MKRNLFTNWQNLLPVTIILALTIGLISWGYNPHHQNHKPEFKDTIPKKGIAPDRKIRDLDDIIDQLDKADFQVDMKKLQKELAEAMEKLNSDQTRMQLEKAQREVDWEKMKTEIEESVAQIDLDKIKKQMTDAMQQVDMAKIQQELQSSLQKIDWEKMKTELEKVKEIDLNKLNEDLKKLKPELEKSLDKAREHVTETKIKMKEFRNFVNDLENDGLLNKKEGYKIKHKSGELEVNGKTVPKSVYDKYKIFLKKHKKFSIEKTDDDFDFDMD